MKLSAIIYWLYIFYNGTLSFSVFSPLVVSLVGLRFPLSMLISLSSESDIQTLPRVYFFDSYATIQANGTDSRFFSSFVGRIPHSHSRSHLSLVFCLDRFSVSAVQLYICVCVIWFAVFLLCPVVLLWFLYQCCLLLLAFIHKVLIEDCVLDQF